MRRKLRTALTAIAIVLGVALITGTYVLTDSIKGAFGGIFTTVYRGTDATVTGKSAFTLSGQSNTTAPPFAQSLLPKIPPNAPLIESVRTYVPVMSATPRTIAIAVSTVRSLRRIMPLSATWIMR